MANQATKQVVTEEENLITEAKKKIAQTGRDLEELKERASHVIEDGIVDAKRMIKKGRYVAEDLVDDTAHYIKHDPWRSVGVTFGVGMGLGVIIGLLIGQKTKKSSVK
jgi:ElaB protein